MKNFLQKGIKTVRSVVDKATTEISSSYGLIMEKVNGLPIFMSLENSNTYSEIQYDEKHYFIIPYHLSEYKFALHTMRCLPNGVPSINNLPKRRVFHFPNEHSETMLKQYMQESASAIVIENHLDNRHPLESLADDIDALDKKLTYGMLLIGSIAAITNPVLGAGIAAKALLPGVADILNKYGLRPTGEKLSKRQLEKAIKEAEEKVIEEFESASTLQVINPVLQELELTLRTTASEHDPLTDYNLANGNIAELDGIRWRELTEVAICHTYKEAYNDSSQHKKAKLGPENLRWLKVLFEVNKD